jgi:hypothetical protein
MSLAKSAAPGSPGLATILFLAFFGGGVVAAIGLDSKGRKKLGRTVFFAGVILGLGLALVALLA